MAAKFEIYKNKSGELHWRPIYINRLPIANSCEGYETKVNAMGGINKSVKENVPYSIVEDRTV